MTEKDKQQLKEYLLYLSKIQIGNYRRDEQLAFWINLYNALTLQVVLQHFPVKSIKDINLNPNFILRFFYSGPWDAELITIDGTPLTLNDIEHKIVRPIWHDPRIHYGLNCASIGCPDLQLQVYTGKNIQTLLQKATKEYINNPRGVFIQDNNLIVSKIYEWYQADFGGSEQAVIDHLKQYANPELKQKLEHFNEINDYRYDWSLNGD